jgi:hypothetical protein
MVNKYFKAGQTIKTVLKGTGKKTKGVQEDNPVVRKAIAKGLKEHRKSDSYKGYKRTMKKLKQNPDLSYMKGQLD